MSPDSYLQFAAAFLSYFLKVAVAYLLCLLLSRLLASPRQRFEIWLGFMCGSLGYWFYVLQSSLRLPVLPGVAEYGPPKNHPFLLPAKFQQPTTMIVWSLGWIYLAGMLLLLTAGIRKRIRLHFLLRQGTAPSPELKSLFAEMCRHFGVRHCELLILPGVSSPATVCWWRPRILLPQVCSELDNSTVMADVLYHELAHVARRDYLWSSLSDLICRLLFFHPAAWQAKKQMCIHREMACDLAVVAARPEHRIDYAQTLTRVARLCLPHKHPVIGIDFAAAPSLLTHRVHAILNTPEQSSGMKRLSRAAAILSLAGGYVFLCSLTVLAIAFAPAAEPVQTVAIHRTSQPKTHPGPHHRSEREPGSSAAKEDEGLITESPAYRMTASSESSALASGLPVNSADRSNGESSNSNIPGWAPPQPGSGSHSAGKTVESVIVATVGTIIGIDRERDKRKDGSGTHFHVSTDSSDPY